MKPLLPLPIDSLTGSLCRELASSTGAVVIAEPGAGKTTRLAPAIMSSRWLAGSASPTVLMLQPRRVAARAAATRIAQEHDSALGSTVGYQIRFENRTGHNTRLIVMTEGILTRRIIDDPFLTGVGCVILDEFHERSIHADMALALLKEIQETVRPDLKIVVMSATLDPAPVSKFLGGVPVFQSPGRLFPVETSYLAHPDRSPVWDLAARSVKSILGSATEQGHVLVFLPGMKEIRRTQEQLHGLPGTELHVLHSSVSSAEQDAALAPSPKRKIILSTNIAETSLTIDGVTAVVDAGLARVPMVNAKLGIDRLELRRISKASADQRAGRAGRTAPGQCARLWTHAENAGLEPFTTPEIHRVDLAGPLLALHAYGVRDVRAFQWFEPPEEDQLSRSVQLLEMLGATTSAGVLTPLGLALTRFPVHPRLACIVLAGERDQILHEAAATAAILEHWDGRSGGSSDQANRTEAFSDLPILLDRFENNTLPSNLDRREVLKTRDHLLRLAGNQSSAAKATSDGQHSLRDEKLAKAIFCGFPDRLTLRRANDQGRGVMVGQRGIALDPQSAVRKPQLFASLDPFDTAPHQQRFHRNEVTASESKVTLASGVKLEWLQELFSHLLSTDEQVVYDAAREKVIMRRSVVFAGLAVSESVEGVSDASLHKAAAALTNFLVAKHGDSQTFLSTLPETAALLARLQFLQQTMPELSIQLMEPAQLDALVLDMCSACRTPGDVKDATGNALLNSALTQPQRQALDKHAPTHLTVPSGRKHKLEYPELRRDSGSAGSEAVPSPILAVRLQELFGLAESPRIAGGRVPVLLHLLAPNYRPVQVTKDLRNFWNTTYAEVRKELRGRYPKHPWPEAPWEALPIAVGRPRRQG